MAQWPPIECNNDQANVLIIRYKPRSCGEMEGEVDDVSPLEPCNGFLTAFDCTSSLRTMVNTPSGNVE